MRGLITIKDMTKSVKYPRAAKDDLGRLRVAAAIGVSADLMDRAAALVQSGVDVLVLDSAHGHSQGILNALSRVKEPFDVDVIAGNIATSDGAQRPDSGRCRRGQGRHRAGFDLHHPHRDRRRRAADHRHFRGQQRGPGSRNSGHRRRRHQADGRRAQGDCRRSQHR